MPEFIDFVLQTEKSVLLRSDSGLDFDHSSLDLQIRNKHVKFLQLLFVQFGNDAIGLVKLPDFSAEFLFEEPRYESSI